MRMNKKGQVFDNVGKLAIGVATLAIILVVAILIVSQGRDQIEEIEGVQSNTSGYNATFTLAEAIVDIPPWIPLIVIAGIGSILLSLVAMFRRGG